MMQEKNMFILNLPPEIKVPTVSWKNVEKKMLAFNLFSIKIISICWGGEGGGSPEC